MDIQEFRQLRVGDVVELPCKSPFGTHFRLVRGVENKTDDGRDNPYAVTVSQTFIFPFQVEEVTPWEKDDRKLPVPWLQFINRHNIKLGDPLFSVQE
jgi:hypothetical protein